MKKTWAIAALLLLPTAAFADVCSDLARSLLDLRKQTLQILSQLTDPDQQAAVRMSYEMQKDQLQAQMLAAGCVAEEVPPLEPDPTPDPDPDPVPPEEEPDPDPTPDPDPDPDPTTPPQSCVDQLDAYAELLRSQNVRQNQFVALMKKKMCELGCYKNYGQWQSHHVRRCKQKKAVECKKKVVQCKKPAKKVSCRR
jgi:hypothetical protein